MRKPLCLSAIVLVAVFSNLASATVVLDIDGNLPTPPNTTTTLADGTTISISQFTGGPNGGLGTVFPNTSSSDFSFSGNGISNPGNGGDWSYIAVDVDFGSSFGVSGDGVVSAADFSLDVSSLNGASNWYEFGFLDLTGTGGTITDAAIQSYLANTSNYTTVNPATEIGTVLGADAANDEHNNGGAGGSSGTGSTDGTFDNGDFGLTATTSITGFTFYYGAVTSDGRTSSPGGSIGDFTDAQELQAIPEPSSAAILFSFVGAMCLRRRR